MTTKTCFTASETKFRVGRTAGKPSKDGEIRATGKSQGASRNFENRTGIST